jgi:hypothetical protein
MKSLGHKVEVVDFYHHQNGRVWYSQNGTCFYGGKAPNLSLEEQKIISIIMGFV